MIRIDQNLVEKAKDLGLNISKVCENALKGMITLIESSNSSKTGENKLEKVILVGPSGFEPESRESKSQSLDHASRQPHVSAEQRIYQML